MDKSIFSKESDTEKNPWLSPINSERKWQEEQLVKIFYHYPNACPKWQYMNGLIANSLDLYKLQEKEDMEINFKEELGKFGYSLGNSIDVQILIDEILPQIFKQFKE